jgi:hypothetical protein
MKKPLRDGLRAAAAILLAAVAAYGLFAHKAAQMREKQVTLASAETREAWLNLRGWRVGEPTVTETLMPAEFLTQAGQNWLRIQHAQGIYPERFAGAELTRYLYPVTDAANSTTYAELLLCGDVLAGAQVYDAATQIMRPVR